MLLLRKARRVPPLPPAKVPIVSMISHSLVARGLGGRAMVFRFVSSSDFLFFCRGSFEEEEEEEDSSSCCMSSSSSEKEEVEEERREEEEDLEEEEEEELKRLLGRQILPLPMSRFRPRLISC